MNKLIDELHTLKLIHSISKHNLVFSYTADLVRRSCRIAAELGNNRAFFYVSEIERLCDKKLSTKDIKALLETLNSFGEFEGIHFSKKRNLINCEWSKKKNNE